MTNFERIKNMTVEKMAKWLCEVAHSYVCNDYCRERKLCDGECIKACIEWLEMEAQE